MGCMTAKHERELVFLGLLEEKSGKIRSDVKLVWWEVILRIVLAMIIGGTVGIQREFQNNAAGFRTHILVSLGACIAMLTNEYLLLEYGHISNIDVARMGSYVISGIGFLGAGSIIKDNMRVRGLTTAAGLWVVACLGVSVGAGYYIAAGVGTVLVVIVLILLKIVEEKIITKKRNRIQISIVIVNSPGHLAKVFGVISETGAAIRNVHMVDTEGELVDVMITTTIPHGITTDVLCELLSSAQVAKIHSIEYI